MIDFEQNNAGLTIGRLAKFVGVNIETIRYYQHIGLIKVPSTPVSGYRKYPYETAKNISFIKRAQSLGFSLREISELLKTGDGHCNEVRLRAENKRTKVEAKIRDLQLLHGTLNKLIDECSSAKNGHHCPIVETLLAHGINVSQRPD